MLTADNTWTLRPATDADFSRWAFGVVRTPADLYSPAIFGPRADFHCECGRLDGPQHADRVCSECGVPVSANSRRLRSRRMGLILLNRLCRHPASAESRICSFPIAPIAYRRDAGGGLTSLGQKYESLVVVNAALQVAEADASDLYLHDSALQEAVSGIVGMDKFRELRATGNMPIPAGSTLVELLLDAAADLRDDIATIARCCGVTIEVQFRV